MMGLLFLFGGLAIGLVVCARLVLGLLVWFDTDVNAMGDAARRKHEWLTSHFGAEGRKKWLRHHRRLRKYLKLCFQGRPDPHDDVAAARFARKLATYDDVEWDRRWSASIRDIDVYMQVLAPWRSGVGYVDDMGSPSAEDWMAADFPAVAAKLAAEQNASWADRPMTDLMGRPIKGTKRGGTDWSLAPILEEASRRMRKNPLQPKPPPAVNRDAASYYARRRKAKRWDVAISWACVVVALVFFVFVVPRLNASTDRQAAMDFVWAWGHHGKEGAYAFYDDRANFSDAYFDYFSPGDVVEVRQDGEGTLDVIEYSLPKRLKTRLYVLTARARPLGTMTLYLAVAKDSHRVCDVLVSPGELQQEATQETDDDGGAVEPSVLAKNLRVTDQHEVRVKTEQSTPVREHVEEVAQQEEAPALLADKVGSPAPAAGPWILDEYRCPQCGHEQLGRSVVKGDLCPNCRLRMTVVGHAQVGQ